MNLTPATPTKPSPGTSEVTFPCGCHAGRFGALVSITPCQLGCPLYRQALRMAHESGAEVDFLRAATS